MMRFRSVKPAAAWIIGAVAIAYVSFIAVAAAPEPKSLALVLLAMAAGAPLSRRNRRRNGFVERIEASPANDCERGLVPEPVDARATVWPHGALFVDIRQQAMIRMLSKFGSMRPQPGQARSACVVEPSSWLSHARAEAQ